MPRTTQLKIEQVSYFLYWIEERHQIHVRRRAKLPKPWSFDTVFQRWFFTNPYRENDKTTVWFREKFREPYRDNPRVLMGTLVFRRFNYIPTGEILLEHKMLSHWDSRVAIDVLQDQPKIFTGAHMISSPYYKPKLQEICRMLDEFYARRNELIHAMHELNRLEDAWNLLQAEHHRGFLPYEVVTDLRHTAFLENAEDVDTWAYFGPGAQRGVCRILGRAVPSSKATSLDQELCRETGKQLLQITRDSLPNMPHFEMREIEHSLCEFDKYMRAREGGNMKRRYDGGG